MSNLLLIHPNPRKKRRSAAQKAATAKMLAANRAKRRGRRSATATVSATPKRKYRRSVIRRAKSATRRYSRRAGAMLRGFSTGGIVPMVKNAGIGAAGAIGVDIAYGAASKFLPDSVKSPMAADGGMNYAYYAAKGALAIGVGMIAGKVVSPSIASKMAEGSLTVTLHDAMKAMIPADSVPMGYASSARIARGGNVRRLSEYVRSNAPSAAIVGNRSRSREMMGEYVKR